MNCVKSYKLSRMVPSVLRYLEKLLFSEPVIGKFTTFGMKSCSISYGIAVGVFFDKRANKNTRKFLIACHVGCTIFVWSACTFYLTDLLVYDVETFTFGFLPIIFTTAKMLFLIFEFYLFGVIEKLVEFFDKDDNSWHSGIPSEEIIQGCIDVKKCVIVALCIFLGILIGADVFYDLDSETEMKSFTRRPHIKKFFPLWCPFENLWAKKAMSAFQDVVILPEFFIFVFGNLLIVICIIELHNKFTELFAKLNFVSKCTFERIEILDRQMEEAMHISNEGIRSNVIKGLNEARMDMMAKFYQDYVSCVERYQQLHRAQLLLKMILDYVCSIAYCFILLITIGFGFVGIQAFSNDEFKFTVKILIWVSICAIAWCMFCYVGDLFSQQNDSFAEEVYSMPWYYLAPKQRKNVFTLLTIIQKPTYLRALKLTDVKKYTFPDFLNSVYSYVQIMRTLQSVKYRNT